MGFLINGSDTRTPAHYHAVITAVSVSSVGMLLTFGLKELGRLPAPPGVTRVLIGLYGGGQFVASIGMFVAGGYGAARKTPTGVGSLDAVAAAGMAVHGIASIFTILGGAAFVVIAIRALLRPDPFVRRKPARTPLLPRATACGRRWPDCAPLFPYGTHASRVARPFLACWGRCGAPDGVWPAAAMLAGQQNCQCELASSSFLLSAPHPAP